MNTLVWPRVASDELLAVVAKELVNRAWRAARDLAEAAGRAGVLAGEDRPLARDQQLSLPRRDPGTGEALEELPLSGDLEGDGLAELRRKQLERLRPRQQNRSRQVVVGGPTARGR